ncbi:hypothetical protein B1222_02225 [Paenibacillus larvae subsp. pulvifaciens]|nr:hypothetical protein B1222_02225 [Paenibacillus larvae subsp. pulvifaciens]
MNKKSKKTKNTKRTKRTKKGGRNRLITRSMKTYGLFGVLTDKIWRDQKTDRSARVDLFIILLCCMG